MTILARLAPSIEGTRLILATAVVIFGLIAVAAVLSRLVWHRRPATRHGLWLSTLALVVVSPAVVAVVDWSGWGRWTVPPVVLPAESGPIVLDPPMPPVGPVEPVVISATDFSLELHPRVEPAPPALAPPIPPTRPAWTRAEWAGLAVLVWLIGLGWGLLRLGLGYRTLGRLCRNLQPFDATTHAATLDQVRAGLDGAKLPPIFVSATVAEPFAAGVGRPLVVVPVGLEGQLLRDVLIHECAHVVRLDLGVGLVQRVMGVILWPHLPVHYLNRQLNRAREEVCDNFVLRGGDPRGYARTLLTLTERRSSTLLAGPALGIVGAGWSLVDRVAGLLDPQRNTMTHSGRLAQIATPAALGGVGLMLALAALRFGPPAAHAASPVEIAASPPAPVKAVVVPDAPPGPGRLVRGLVVDAAGQPVAGALVHPVRLAKAPEGATTAADGTFALTLRGYFLLREDLIAAAEGGNRLGVAEFREPTSAAAPAPVRITLKPSRSVTVRVRDTAGAPVPGAAVEVNAAEFSFDRTGQTGPDGATTIRYPADGQVRWVVAHKDEVGFDYFENYQTRPATDFPPLPAEVALTLDGAATARIKAVDSAGQPVAGVSFYPWLLGKPGKLDQANIGGSLTTTATTGAAGMATFAWLPAQIEQGVSFLLHDELYSCPNLPVFVGKGTAELTAKLLRNTPIRGTVRQEDGQPAPGVLIQAEGRGNTTRYCRKYTRTDADGRYQIDVYPDQMYVIAVLDDARAARSLTGIVVAERQPQAGLDFNLVPGTLLQGQVTSGPDRTPAPGVWLSLIEDGAARLEGPNAAIGGHDGEHSLVRFGQTDAQGRYQFRVGPGRFRLIASKIGSQTQRGEVTVSSPDAAAITRDFHLTGYPEPREFRGQVIETTPTGPRPVAGALVEAVGARNASVFTTRADAEGRFHGPRRQEGPIVVYAQSPDGTLAGFATFVAETNEGQATVQPAARISGRVLDAAGQPSAGTRVQVRFGSGADHATAGRIIRRATTDDQGRYTCAGVPVPCRGEVAVRAADPDRDGRTYSQPFEVSGEGLVTIADLKIPGDRVP